MKLEKQACSLELAKKLDKLDIDRDGYAGFYWCEWASNEPTLEFVKGRNDFVFHTGGCLERYIAFTSSELGEMIPGNFSGCYTKMQKGFMGNRWYCTLETMDKHEFKKQFEAKTEADARAKMLIYLIENDLL